MVPIPTEEVFVPISMLGSQVIPIRYYHIQLCSGSNTLGYTQATVSFSSWTSSILLILLWIRQLPGPRLISLSTTMLEDKDPVHQETPDHSNFSLSLCSMMAITSPLICFSVSSIREWLLPADGIVVRLHLEGHYVLFYDFHLHPPSIFFI